MVSGTICGWRKSYEATGRSYKPFSLVCHSRTNALSKSEETEDFLRLLCFNSGDLFASKTVTAPLYKSRGFYGLAPLLTHILWVPGPTAIFTRYRLCFTPGRINAWLLGNPGETPFHHTTQIGSRLVLILSNYSLVVKSRFAGRSNSSPG